MKICAHGIRMNYGQYFAGLAVLVGLSVLYERMDLADRRSDSDNHYSIVRKFLVERGEGEKLDLSKPFLWIHLEDRVNARWWRSFGSRNNRCLSQPYQYLTMKSIIDRCARDFSICIIEDDSFSELLPNWGVDLSQVAEPVRDHMRELGMAELLFSYGGLRLPSSFLAFRSCLPIFLAAASAPGGLAMGDGASESGGGPPAAGARNTSWPRSRIMASIPQGAAIRSYCDMLTLLNTTDLTAQPDFLGASSQWGEAARRGGGAIAVSAALLGGKDRAGDLVGIERLLGSSYVDLEDAALGIDVPAEEMLRRTAYQWFARLSAKQALESDTCLGKFLLVASRPDVEITAWAGVGT